MLLKGAVIYEKNRYSLLVRLANRTQYKKHFYLNTVNIITSEYIKVHIFELRRMIL